MDLVNSVVGLQSASTLSRVQMAVAKRILDTQKMHGAAAIQLLQAATTQVDTAGQGVVAATTNLLGGQVDLYA